MREIIKVEKINNLITIDIIGTLSRTRIGDILTDDVGNSFHLDSVALSGSVRRNTNITTLVVTRKHGNRQIGKYIDVN